ncbi:MAG: hypothetical protein IK066_07700, partial [Kiritimatiellae bacterium]|nr:hypothetical protein [Kiritimatiellia bacterium]
MKSVAKTAWGLAAGLALGLAAARAPAMQLRVQPMDTGTNAWVVAAGKTFSEETLLVARDVSWSGTAERDLWVLGQKRVAFGGRALQDARLAGASVEITDGAVSGNLAVAGQGVRLAANVPVEGDLAVLAAGEALCEADVRGDARVWA